MEHDGFLMRSDVPDAALEAGRALLAAVMDGVEHQVPPEAPLDPGLATEEYKLRAWLRRDNLDALLIHCTGGTWRVQLLLKRPALCASIDTARQASGPLKTRQEAVDLAAREFLKILWLGAEEAPAQKAFRAAEGTFHLRRRPAGRQTDLHPICEKDDPMALDCGFYNQCQDALLSFHNHHRLLDLLRAEPHVVLPPPYDDFYVTRPMVAAVLAKVEAEMQAGRQTLTPLRVWRPRSRRAFLKGIPAGFCDREPESWTSALPQYRLLLTRLLALVRHEGVLICGWSA